MLFRRQWNDSNRTIRWLITLHDRIKARPRIAAYLELTATVGLQPTGHFSPLP